MKINDDLHLVTVIVANLSANGVLGTAINTVDIAARFSINQTSPNITATLPAPTDTRTGKVTWVSNIGTASLLIYGVTIGVNQFAEFQWTGASWQAQGVALVSDFWNDVTVSRANPDGTNDKFEGISHQGTVHYGANGSIASNGYMHEGIVSYRGDGNFQNQYITTNIPADTAIMPTIYLKGYVYGTSDIVDIAISLYTYASPSKSIINTAWVSRGSKSPVSIRAGFNAANMLILEVNWPSNEYFTRYEVSSYCDGNSASPDTFFQGWSIANGNFPATVTNVITVARKPLDVASFDFWRNDPTATLPDGITDVAEAIVRTGQTKIDTNVNGDSGFTLDDLRSRNSAQVSAGDGGVTDTNMSAIGVDINGKVRLSNQLSIPDLRATNPNPQDYAAGFSNVFKQSSTIGLTTFSGVPSYVNLETTRRYAQGGDFSGGQVIQRVFLEDGRAFYRVGTSGTTWGWWQLEQQPNSNFNLQDLLRLNGTAKVSLAGEVSWSNRFITMTAGITTQEPSGYHDIYMPAVGAIIPVQGGGSRTVLAATAGQSGQSGGILINAWESLWYRAVRGTGNGTVATNFIIMAYTSNANTATPAILNQASYAGTHAGEWIRICTRDDANKFSWGTGDCLSLGGQFGGGHDLTIANWTAMKNRAALDGYAFATFATALPQRVGLTGTIRWIDAGSNSYVNSQGYVDSTPAGRTSGTVIYGVNGAANRTWETLTAADALAKFGGAQGGNSPITPTSTVVQLNDNEALYYAANIDNTGQNTGTWYVAGYAGNMTIPIHWLPVFSYQVTGANSTTHVLIGGVQKGLRAGEAVFAGHNDGDIERLHRNNNTTYNGIKYTRLTHTGFFTGAAANGILGSAEGFLVSWDDNLLIRGISSGYVSKGEQYSFINVPTVGASIPVAMTNGAVTHTRVVQNISGRRYVPLGIWEALYFIPPAYTGGYTSQDRDFVIGYYNGNHSIPTGATLVAMVNSAAGISGSSKSKTRIKFADGTYMQGGCTYASATLALRVENDQAQGSGDWRLITVAGQTGAGMNAVMPAIAGVLGNYGAPYTSYYNYQTNADDPRGEIILEGLLLLGTNIAVGSPNIAFMAGVQVRGAPIRSALINASTQGDNTVIHAELRFYNGTQSGQSGTFIQLYSFSGNTAVNPQFTLGLNGGAAPAGVLQWLALDGIRLPHL
jgi:hypothetical protein